MFLLEVSGFIYRMNPDSFIYATLGFDVGSLSLGFMLKYSPRRGSQMGFLEPCLGFSESVCYTPFGCSGVPLPNYTYVSYLGGEVENGGRPFSISRICPLSLPFLGGSGVFPRLTPSRLSPRIRKASPIYRLVPDTS